jgi:hypothetical protein
MMRIEPDRTNCRLFLGSLATGAVALARASAFCELAAKVDVVLGFTPKA